MSCSFCQPDQFRPRRIRDHHSYYSMLSDPCLHPGHTVIIPKHHYETLHDIPQRTINAMMVEARRVSGIIINERVAPGCDVWQKYAPFMPDGRIKQSHLHLHVIPRWPEDRLLLLPDGLPDELFSPLPDSQRDALLALL